MGLNRGFFYVWMANNLSQSWAIYCLVMLYRVTHDDLQRIKPLLKFIYIKAVVFFSFWQAVALALIIKFKLLRPFCSGTICISSTYALEATIVDVVICVEMFMCVGLPLRPSFVFSSPPRRGPLGRGRLRSVDRSMAIVRARSPSARRLTPLSLSLSPVLSLFHSSTTYFPPLFSYAVANHFVFSYKHFSLGADREIDPYSDAYAELANGDGGDHQAGRSKQGAHRSSMSTSFLFAATDPAFFRALGDAFVPTDMAAETVDLASSGASSVASGVSSLAESLNPFSRAPTDLSGGAAALAGGSGGHARSETAAETELSPQIGDGHQRSETA